MPFEKLRTWKLAHALALSVNAEADRWPRQEIFVLTAQVRRAAISVPNNIAEGSLKRGPKEYRRHLDIALGSFSELTYLLIFARDRGYLAPDRWTALDESRAILGRALWRLYRAISEKVEART